MGYLHIDNLYKNQTVLMFKSVYALEKIHGTSAHITYERGKPLHFHHGGASRDAFLALFDEPALRARFEALPNEHLTVYGEAYGGKLHRGRHDYGDALRFVAFDVKHRELAACHSCERSAWLDVPGAQAVCTLLELPFVDWRAVPSDLATLDALRDAPSEQARRDTGRTDAWSEGIIIRPPMELNDHRGNRIIAKHKRLDARETATPRMVGTQPEVLAAAEAVAREWVTPMRLEHVLDHLAADGASIVSMALTPRVIAAMTEDVLREGAGEIIDSKAVRRAVGSAAAKLFKARVAACIPSG